jgi:hypothetical protein
LERALGDQPCHRPLDYNKWRLPERRQDACVRRLNIDRVHVCRVRIHRLSQKKIYLDAYGLLRAERERLFGQHRLARAHQSFKNHNSGAHRPLGGEPSFEHVSNFG